MKSRLLLFGFLALAMISLTTFGLGTVWGQEAPAAGTEEEVPPKKEIPEKVLPKVPTEAPGYFPRGLPPSPVSSLELSAITTTLGPASGVLAPYGNPAAYDTLVRGWMVHKLGVFQVSPFLEYDGIYRTNVFQTPSHKQSDFVNTINPGLRFELPIAQQHRISAGYLGNYLIYSRFPNALSHNDHNVNLDLLFNFRGGLTVRLGDAFRYATVEPSGAEQPRARPYTKDTPYLQASYNVSSKTQIQGFYQFDHLLFQVGNVNSFAEQSGGVALYYKFWPKTAAFAQYIISSRNYPDSRNDNSTINSPLIGLTWDPTAKLSGTAKFGYSFVNYEKKLPTRNNSPGSLIVSVQTNYRFTRYTTLSLTAQRSKQDDIDVNNSPFWNTGIFVNLSHDWHYFKTTTYIGSAFINNSYINSDVNKGALKREDNILYLTFGAARPITSWLRLRVDYNYANKSSNSAGLGYNEHRVLFGIQFSI